MLHPTALVVVGGIKVSIENADDDAPEVHISGDGDLGLDAARQLAAALLAAADRLAAILDGAD